MVLRNKVKGGREIHSEATTFSSISTPGEEERRSKIRLLSRSSKENENRFEGERDMSVERAGSWRKGVIWILDLKESYCV